MRPIDADKLHYKRIHFYDIKDGECSGLKSAVVVFADEIDKNESARISPDDVRGVGKWVDKGVRAWSCSCCGTPLNHIRQFASFEKNELPNYCPNCGARMKGAETSE